MKKIILALLIVLVGLPTIGQANGGHSGGAIAGGVLGGLALGALLASRPRRTEREVIVEKVYVDKYGNPITPRSKTTEEYETREDEEEYEEDNAKEYDDYE